MNTRRLIILITGLIPFSLILFPLANQTSGAPSLTFTVTSNVDMTDALPGDGVCETATGNGMCTLRAAIMEANAHIGADTIILPAATYNLTILGANEDFSASGDLDIRESLTIIGDQNGSTTIDAAGLGDRVLQITHFNDLVSISNLRIQHGDTFQDGGGIYSSAPLEVNNSSISWNHADYSGGGIYSSSPLTITYGEVFNNSAWQDGGGLYNRAPMTMRNTNVYSNDSDQNGGGLFIYSSNAYFKEVSLSSNHSIYSGGAIYNHGANLTLVDTYLLANRNDANGGGIYNTSNGVISMSNVHIALNIAHLSGAGIYNEGSIEGQDVLFDQNSSETENGGAIVNKGTIDLTKAVLSSNRAIDGGAILNWSAGTITLMDSMIAGNMASGSGGGILSDGSVTLDEVTVMVNGAGDAGGLYSTNDLKIKNSTIHANTGLGFAGGIYNIGTLTIENSTISENIAHEYNGGGIYSKGTAYVSNSTITKNIADYQGSGYSFGGGLFAENGSSFTIRNTIIFDNHHKYGTDLIDDDCWGLYTSMEYNLIGAMGYWCHLDTDQGHDLIGVDPLLGPWADNGGSTLTYALLAGSSAIDGGNPAGCYDQLGKNFHTDQRGYLRHWDGDGDGVARCDIGAYEYNSVIQFFLPITRK